MSILKIVTYPAKVLKQKAAPVTEITKETALFLDEMADVMYAASGVGLAAPQVGVSLRYIVVDAGIQKEDGTIESNLLQLINPEITNAEGETKLEEGCLSCGDFRLTVKRAAKIHVKSLDKTGKPIEFDAEDLLAIIIQHEIDHLNGITLLGRISPLKRELWFKDQQRKKKEQEEQFDM